MNCCMACPSPPCKRRSMLAKLRAFSQIEIVGWALVVEEPWEAVDNPLLRTTQAALLVLILILLFALIAPGFGIRQIVQRVHRRAERRAPPPGARAARRYGADAGRPRSAGATRSNGGEARVAADCGAIRRTSRSDLVWQDLSTGFGEALRRRSSRNFLRTGRGAESAWDRCRCRARRRPRRRESSAV